MSLPHLLLFTGLKLHLEEFAVKSNLVLKPES